MCRQCLGGSQLLLRQAHPERVLLSEPICCKSFLSRSAPAPGAAARQAATLATVIEFSLEEAAWLCIISEIIASDASNALGEAGAVTFSDHLAVVSSTVFVSPDQL